VTGKDIHLFIRPRIKECSYIRFRGKKKGGWVKGVRENAGVGGVISYRWSEKCSRGVGVRGGGKEKERGRGRREEGEVGSLLSALFCGKKKKLFEGKGKKVFWGICLGKKSYTAVGGLREEKSDG